jgi:hypothetical protein
MQEDHTPRTPHSPWNSSPSSSKSAKKHHTSPGTSRIYPKLSKKKRDHTHSQRNSSPSTTISAKRAKKYERPPGTSRSPPQQYEKKRDHTHSHRNSSPSISSKSALKCHIAPEASHTLSHQRKYSSYSSRNPERSSISRYSMKHSEITSSSKKRKGATK